MSPYSLPRALSRCFPRLQLRPLIQRVHTLDEYQQAYDDAISGKYIKIVLTAPNNQL